MSIYNFTSLSVVQAPYLLHIEVIECADTYLSPLPAKQLDVSVHSAGLNSSLAGVCVRSEGASPSSMRATSLSCLTETETVTLSQVSGVPCTHFSLYMYTCTCILNSREHCEQCTIVDEIGYSSSRAYIGTVLYVNLAHMYTLLPYHTFC